MKPQIHSREEGEGRREDREILGGERRQGRREVLQEAYNKAGQTIAK